MYYMPFFYDPYFWMIILGVAISGWASMNVNSTFNRYDQIQNHGNYTGKVAARYILDQAGLYEVEIREVAGNLTDNYNPTNKVLSLSQSVYNSSSIAAVGVAAHEVGHALQDASDYAPMRLRSALVPIVSLGSNLSMPLILLGLVLGMNQTLIKIGIWCFALVLVFQVVTLPVEFNASHRALRMLNNGAILDPQDMPIVRKVLFAAALTYVAAVLTSMLQLFRLILIFGRHNDDNN
ncbi:zinc metallopeptidase [Lactobacillus taiwanensis]|uniref:zinc metallopeptidase n=1 Tax=Lactobacillus taiwanensis TaxID=508451 RepID=UPI0025B18B03|nr:zinc metallopeptidase [Lactobacillus taiwanensis]